VLLCRSPRDADRRVMVSCLHCQMFPPSAVHSHRGVLVEGHKTASLLHHKLLQYMTRLLHDGRGHSSWPRLGFIRSVIAAFSSVNADLIVLL